MLTRLERCLKLIDAPGRGASAAAFRTRITEMMTSCRSAVFDETQLEQYALNENFGVLMSDMKEHFALLGTAGEEALSELNAIIGKPTPTTRVARNTTPLVVERTDCRMCGAAMLLDESRFLCVCSACGLTSQMLGLQVNDQITRPNVAPIEHTHNKEFDTLNKLLQHIQGELANEPLDEELQKEWPRIEAQFKIDYSNAALMNIENVRFILKHLSLRRYCKVAPYLYKRYTGKPVVTLSKDEMTHIWNAFREILLIWNQVKIPGITNLPTCSMILYEIIDSSGWSPARVTEIQRSIYHLEEETVRRFRTTFWRVICTESASRRVKNQGTIVFRYRW